MKLLFSLITLHAMMATAVDTFPCDIPQHLPCTTNILQCEDDDNTDCCIRNREWDDFLKCAGKTAANTILENPVDAAVLFGTTALYFYPGIGWIPAVHWLGGAGEAIARGSKMAAFQSKWLGAFVKKRGVFATLQSAKAKEYGVAVMNRLCSRATLGSGITWFAAKAFKGKKEADEGAK